MSIFKRIEDTEVVARHGIFRRRISFFQAVTLIVGATIGAGVLGIPYAVSPLGVWWGSLYIAGIGALMIGLNIMLGQVAARAGTTLQLVGLAKRYLGRAGELIMTLLVYVILFGVLVVYIIGEGHALAVLFGGEPFFWSIIFFIVGAAAVMAGMRSVKMVDLVASLGILVIILIIALVAVPHFSPVPAHFPGWAGLLFPYGVILFAFHGTTAVPEAHALLSRRDRDFKRAIMTAGFINIIAYVVFAAVVVGVTGSATTEIATIGLGQKVGPSMVLFGNIFAVLAMGTSFMTVGLSLRDSLSWDYRIRPAISALMTVLIPFFIFIAGLRNFIEAIDIVGGVFVSFEMLLIMLIYWRAWRLGDLSRGRYRLHNAWLLGAALVFALTVGTVYSLTSIFTK